MAMREELAAAVGGVIGHMDPASTGLATTKSTSW